MKLHHLRVRRSRRLPMPLPPTPKRPLGPPVLFAFRGVSIRTRVDAIEASGSWDEFLDDMADCYVNLSESLPGNFLRLIERLVPAAEQQAHCEAMRARCEERREAERAANEAFRAEVAEKGIGGLIRDRLFGRAA